MASILELNDFRSRIAPRWWVDHGANDRNYEQPSGWTRSLRAVAEVMFADRAGPPADERLRWLCGETKNFVEGIGGKGALVFRLGLFATDWIAPVFAWKLPPLRRLHWVDRVIALKRYEESPLGLSLFAVKVFTSLIWFENPEHAQNVGFDGGALRP